MRTALDRGSARPRIYRATAVVALLLVLLLMPEGRAAATDRVIARDTHIARVWALDGMVVYQRLNFSASRPWLKRGWMRIVNGRVLPVRGLPTRAGGTSIGLDARGRVVLPVIDTFGTWWLYDVAIGRARPFPGLPTSLDDCSEVAIWRTRLAYSSCDHVYLRTGKRARRVPIAWTPGSGDGGLTLRGAALFGQVSDTSDGIYVSLLADASGFCTELVPGLAGGDAGSLSGWWVSRHYLTWTLGNAPGNGPLLLLGARLKGQCRIPGPTRRLFTVPSGNEVLAVDDRFAYYGESDPIHGSATIRRHRLPSRPPIAPPQTTTSRTPRH